MREGFTSYAGAADMMRRATASIAIIALGACTASATGAPAARSANAERKLVIARLENQVLEQSGRIAELEARLALLEQETRGTRGPAPKSMETIRIGGGAQAAHAGATPPVAAAESGNLKVVPLPDEPADKARPVSAALLRDASATSLRDQYRAALRLVREGRWEEALPALSSFLAQYPHDDLSDNARYWRGEVHYALRRYDEAMNEFQGVLARFPASDKAADCLLKIGMCHLRRGDRVEAQRYFEQVIAQYPKSDAARIASKEGSS